MSMSVNDVYKLCQYILSKNIQQGYLSPEEFNRTINIAQKGYASYLLGNFQQYLPGKPTARVEFGQNSVIRQRLAPIIYGDILTIDGNGFCTYPSDYTQIDAMLTMNFRRIRQIQQDYFYSVYGSVIDPIANNPIFEITDTGFQFYPTNLGQARISYVRNPPDMTWAYTTDGDGLPIYDSANSVQPVWDDLSMLEIIVRALQMAGVSLQFPDVVRYAQEIKNVGQ